MKREGNDGYRQPSPTVTFYNGNNVQGNAMGSMADREGFNNGKYNERQTERAYGR